MNALTFSEALVGYLCAHRRVQQVHRPHPVDAGQGSQQGAAGKRADHLAESLRIVAVLIAPFMTRTPEKIFDQLGIDAPALKTWESVQQFGGLVPGTKVRRAGHLPAHPGRSGQKEQKKQDKAKPQAPKAEPSEKRKKHSR